MKKIGILTFRVICNEGVALQAYMPRYPTDNIERKTDVIDHGNGYIHEK